MQTYKNCEKCATRDEFDSIIGQLDRVLSKLVGWAKEVARAKKAGDGEAISCIDLADQQTLKHHAEDMEAAVKCIYKNLGVAVEGTPQPKSYAVMGVDPAEEQVCCIPTNEVEVLFKRPDVGHFAAIDTRKDKADLIELLQRKGTFVPKSEAETREDMQQIIPYIIVCRRLPDQNLEYLSYRRVKGSGEVRLLGKRSIGIGGHINLKDHRASVMQVRNPTVLSDLQHGALREIQEEVNTKAPWSLQIIGIVRNVDNGVGRVHFGIVMSLLLEEGQECVIADSCMEEGQWSLDTPLSNLSDYEVWSQLILGVNWQQHIHDHNILLYKQDRVYGKPRLEGIFEKAAREVAGKAVESVKERMEEVVERMKPFVNKGATTTLPLTAWQGHLLHSPAPGHLKMILDLNLDKPEDFNLARDIKKLLYPYDKSLSKKLDQKLIAFAESLPPTQPAKETDGSQS